MGQMIEAAGLDGLLPTPAQLTVPQFAAVICRMQHMKMLQQQQVSQGRGGGGPSSAACRT